LKVHYDEGLFVGYKWYDQFNVEPLYEFGSGLSYTTFSITGPITATRSPGKTAYEIQASVKNNGKISGKQTVQLYLGIPDSAEPPKLLRGFEKVFLGAGEVTVVSFCLTEEDFQIGDKATGK
jgi:beta-glucosidase